MTDPFRVTATRDETAEGRNIAVTIHDVVVSDGVTTDSGWSATGTWLVVDLDAWALRTESPASIRAAYLLFADRIVSASERPTARDSAGSLLNAPLRVDIPQSGSIAFEIPADAVAQDAVLQLAQGNTVGPTDPALSIEGDSVIELPLSLGDIDRVTQRELLRTEWTGP